MDPTEMLKAIDDFYQQAWDKLLIYTGILVAVVGIVIPILFNWLQTRTQLIREDAIKKELGNAFDAKLKEIEEKLIGDIEKKIKDKTSEIEKMIINKFGLAQAVSFHMLGNKCREEKEFKEALNDFCTAGIGYLKGEDILNIQRVNANIKLTLSEIKKEDLESLLEEESQPINYISLLEDSDKNGIFTDLIKDFKRLVAKKIKSEDKA